MDTTKISNPAKFALKPKEGVVDLGLDSVAHHDLRSQPWRKWLAAEVAADKVNNTNNRLQPLI
jgi:hypothetical protein